MFDIGHFADGLNKGMKYVAATIKIAGDGFHQGNEEKLQDALHVLLAWEKEVEREANPIVAALTGDPFSGSRKLAQELKAKYPK